MGLAIFCFHQGGAAVFALTLYVHLPPKRVNRCRKGVSVEKQFPLPFFVSTRAERQSLH
jgi:hypothetical protein